MFRYLIAILVLLNTSLLFGQDVEFTVQAPSSVEVGQRFRITYTVNSNVNSFESPQFTDFEVLQGPQKQSGSSTYITNGNVKSTVTNSFTFIVSAKKAGTLNIPSAKVDIKGNQYLSEPKKISVINSNSSNNQQQANSKNNKDIDIFIKASVSNSSPYIGQPIDVVYKLYTPTNRLQIGGSTKEPSFQGFWVEDLMKDATQYNQYNETYNGKKYIVVELRKYSLIPQQSGNLTIDKFENQVVYAVQVKNKDPFGNSDFFNNDPFFQQFFDQSIFGSQYQNVSTTVSSNQITINVKPLPSNNKPIDFSGAVGRMEITSSVNKNTIKVNDALTYKVTITGEGNLKLIQLPEINFPPDFEVYEPKITENFSNKTKTKGAKVYEYLIIPRATGSFTIPQIDFNYFNPYTSTYQSSNANSINVEITKGNGNYVAESNEVKMIDVDIRHINEGNFETKQKNHSLFDSYIYWIAVIIMAIAFIVFVILHLKNNKLRQNQSELLQRRATKIAHKRLKKSKEYLMANKHNEFHEELSNALWLYISNKFKVPFADLSLETTRETLTKQNVDKNIIERFLKVLNDCNYAQYAPNSEAINMKDLYENAVDVITKTESELK